MNKTMFKGVIARTFKEGSKMSLVSKIPSVALGVLILSGNISPTNPVNFTASSFINNDSQQVMAEELPNQELKQIGVSKIKIGDSYRLKGESLKAEKAYLVAAQYGVVEAGDRLRLMGAREREAEKAYMDAAKMGSFESADGLDLMGRHREAEKARKLAEEAWNNLSY